MTAKILDFAMHKAARQQLQRETAQNEIDAERLTRWVLSQGGACTLAGIAHALDSGHRLIDEGHGYIHALRTARRVLSAPAYQREVEGGAA
jgi:hypothetical protein